MTQNDTADADPEWTVDQLANHVDAEIRNPARGMSLGFIDAVDADYVHTRSAADDGVVTRPADKIVRMLNNPESSWEVHDDASLSDL